MKEQEELSPQEQKIIQEYYQKTACPSIRLEAVREPAGPLDSKLGGRPYLPAGIDYPCGSDGNPLYLLAQLNFAQLPPLPGFPQNGILQFYTADGDLVGVDFDAPTEQRDFRILFFDAPETASGLVPSPPMPEPEQFPFQGEFRLRGRLFSDTMTPCDFHFDKQFLDIYRRYCNTEAQTVYDLNRNFIDVLYDGDISGHKIGGYPFFTQSDPRQEGTPYTGHTVLLLQIDSDGDGEDEIIWGDCGVANFFITPEALAQCDFSNVLYNWDCG